MSKTYYDCRLCNARTKRPAKHYYNVHSENEDIRLNPDEILEKYFVKQPNIQFDPFFKPLDIIRPGRKIEKVIIREDDCIDYSFIWEDLIFKNKCIQIYIKRLDKQFLEIECKNSVESLNKIKEEFFMKHHGHKLYKLKACDNKVILNWSRDVQSILDLTDSAIEFYNFRYEKTKKAKYLSEKVLESFSNEEILKLFKHTAAKEPYLKYLYNLHHEKYKLIPILEFIGNTQEESFLFRINDKNGRILVVWENLNPSRATYLFRLQDKNRQLKNILAYIAEQEKSKRLFLRQGRNKAWATKHLGYVAFIEHIGIHEYKNLILNYLKF